jgi:hypothetical protein
MSSSSRPEVIQEIEAAARAVRDDASLDRIRTATARLAAREIDPSDPRAALALAENQVDIDLEVPTASRLWGVAFVKRAIKRLVGWYLRYVGHQVTMAGRAMVRLGEALVDRTEALDRAVAANRRAIDDLEARVERLEHNQS